MFGCVWYVIDSTKIWTRDHAPFEVAPVSFLFILHILTIRVAS